MISPVSTIFFHRRVLVLLLVCGLGAFQTIAAQENSDRQARRAGPSAPSPLLLEEFSFHVKNFKMDHQGEVQTLNIKMSFQYVNGIGDTAYPDFRIIARDV